MTQADKEEEVNWLECVSAIETHKGVVYFCNNEYFAQGKWSCGHGVDNTATAQQKSDTENEHVYTNKQDSSACIQHTNDEADSRRIVELSESSKPILTAVADFVSRFDHGRFMYSITAYNPLDTNQDSVQNCHGNQLLLADLRTAFPDGEIFKNFSFFPHRPHHFERGFTVVLPLDYPIDHEGVVHNLALKYRQAAYFKCRIFADGRSTQTIVLLEDYVKEVQESLVVVERLSYHPAYLHRNNNSVFHGFHDAMNTLFKCDYLPEAGQLVDIAKQHLAIFPAWGTTSRKLLHPVLVVEGTHGAGVSKHSLDLNRIIGGTHLQSPPSCLQHLRATFEAQNQLIQGAFYTVGNYILASQVEEASKHAPVVLDRFWSSTAAFTITSEVGMGCANLPPRDHFIYEWPRDLLQPDAIILVGSRKNIRRKSGPRSQAEKGERIAKKLMFEALRRMKTSSWIEVDRIRDRCHSDEAVTMVTIDKLHERRVGDFHLEVEVHGMCPSTTLHPKCEHDLLPVQGEGSSAEGSKVRCRTGQSEDKEIGFL